MILDRKMPFKLPGNSSVNIDYYLPQVVSHSDYYPYGMTINSEGRTGNFSTYRYGNNGQEKDNEVYGIGNSYTAEFWNYDPKLGRRWNVDPVDYADQSPYATFNNNPICFIDPTGAVGEPVKKFPDVYPDGKPNTGDPINVGYDTKDVEFKNYLFESVLGDAAAIFKAKAQQGSSPGYEMAAGFMLKYLNGDGSTVTIDLQNVMETDKEGKFNHDYAMKSIHEDVYKGILAQSQAPGYNGGVITGSFKIHPLVRFAHGGKGYYFALGHTTVHYDVSYAFQPKPTLDNPEAGELAIYITAKIYESYTWDAGKTTIMPLFNIEFTDTELKELMITGLAKEFLIYGEFSQNLYYSITKTYWDVYFQYAPFR